MSFLSELKKQKDKLKETQTIVTSVDGQRFLESANVRKTIDLNAYGFVVDTKPDDIPVMITDFLYIGSQDCATSDVLQLYDIKHVLSLGIDLRLDYVDNKFVDCLDLPETDIKPVLNECLPFLHKTISCRENVLVHCNAGVSRTSMVAIGYLMQYHGMQFDEAYGAVKEKRPAIQPNAGFKKQLKDLSPCRVI